MNTSLSLATPPNADEAPCTTTALLAEGPQWLYDTIQPSTAIVHARGAATVIAAANRIIRWVPLGWGWTANVVLEVDHIDWGVGMGPPLNPCSAAKPSASPSNCITSASTSPISHARHDV
jgi:hypothetical protein